MKRLPWQSALMPCKLATTLSPRKIFASVLLAAVCIACAFLVPRPAYITTDFFSFWAAARLRAGQYYDPAAIEAVQVSVCNQVRQKRYIRPAFYAVALRPLGILPFRTAELAWFFLNLGALFGFLRLWRPSPSAALTAAIFAPLGWSFFLGQDTAMLLLAFGAGVILIEAGRPWAGGAALSWCGVKPNLFFLLPIVLLAQKRYRAFAGLVTGGALLYLIGAWDMGLAWPREFARAALDNEATIAPNIPGVGGLLAAAAPAGWRLVPALVGVAWTWAWSRGADWRSGAAFALAAGLVLAPRSVIYDGSILLPALLLRSSTFMAALVGVGLSFANTELRPLVQAASPLLLWLARPRLGAGQTEGRKSD